MTLNLERASIGYSNQPELISTPHWSCHSGGLHVILGSNGSGKSTLLRTVLGIQSLKKGELYLETKSGKVDPTHGDSWVRNMAFVPSSPPRDVGLTGMEVLQLSGSRGEIERRFAHLMPWWNLRLSNMSDGQAQQIMVARAMLQSQHWVVLDEPTAFLDLNAQRVLWGMLDEHLTSDGSVLMATHDLRGVHRGLQQSTQARKDKSSLTLIQDQALHPVSLELTLEELERICMEDHLL